MQPGAAEKKPVRITVCGQSFTVLAPGDPADFLQLAGQVDEIMSRIAARSGHADSMRAAILTCLHLADRARALERELDQIRARIAASAGRVAALLDRAAGPPR
jgi:cell division protein ZapA (FtsZ GTPase activity inhibitor)